MSAVEYLIPVERGKEWNQGRALGSLPPGVRYTIAEHDEGELVDAVNEGVKQAKHDLVFVAAPDVWVGRDPDTLKFLADQAWNADVLYGPLVHWADGGPAYAQGQEHFCPNRLYRENYIPGVACVRRDAFASVGGLTSGMWDFYIRSHEAGLRIKYVAEATSARDAQPPDPSPVPQPKEVLATFYYQATPGTAYWRCLLPARFLPGQAIFNHPMRVVGDDGSLTLPQQEGAAIMQFTGDESHYLLAKYLKDKGVRVLVEVDDNYSRWFPDHMKLAGWKEKIADTMQDVPRDPEDESKGTVKVPYGYSVEAHLETVKLADGVIATTPYLAAQYRKHNENVFVCGNHIDPQDWPDLEKPDDGVFRIGWFASGSHRMDGELAERALAWAGRQKDVEIVLVGVGASGPGRPWYTSFPFKHYGWSNDFGVYRRFLMEFDVGLCPVKGTPWALCRSDLKVLENSMGGAVSFVSDVPCYEHTEVPHMQRCKTPKDWLRAVQWACANRDEVREQGLVAREYVLRERTMEKNVSQWVEAVAA